MGSDILKDCILTVINESVGIESVRAAREEFGNPIVCLTLYQYVENEIKLTQEEKDYIGRFYSVPDFYFEHIEAVRKLDLKELVDKLQAFEASLDIEDGYMIVSHDRQYFKLADFRQSRELQLIHLMLVDKILGECSPFLCMAGYGMYLCEILIGALANKGVPNMAFYVDRFTLNRQVAVSPKGQFLGMQEAFKALMEGREADFDKNTIKDADALYEAFVESPVRPFFADYRSRSTLKVLKNVLVSGAKSISDNIRKYRENEYDRICGRLESSLENMMGWPSKSFRMGSLEYGALLDKSPELSCKYFYLPLHYKPEVTDMFYGSDYDHHEGFVAQLSKKIPSGYKLYVKEHTSMLGLRPISFYKKLQSIHNVEMVHPHVSTFELIKNGVTIVVTGTAGWEAYLLQRPAIVLGNCFYNFLPGVLHAHLYQSGFQKQVKDYLAGFKPDKYERKVAMRAGLICSVPVGENVNIVSSTSIRDHAARYAAARKKLYDKWGRWLIENDPTIKTQ